MCVGGGAQGTSCVSFADESSAQGAPFAASMHPTAAASIAFAATSATASPAALQLAETRARDEAESAAQEGKVALRAALKPRIDAWCGGGKAGNIRALLASLHTVLWEGSGWVPPTMSDMLEGAKVCVCVCGGGGCVCGGVCGVGWMHVLLAAVPPAGLETPCCRAEALAACLRRPLLPPPPPALTTTTTTACRR